MCCDVIDMPLQAYFIIYSYPHTECHELQYTLNGENYGECNIEESEDVFIHLRLGIELDGTTQKKRQEKLGHM